MRVLLAVWLCFGLATPQGWASAALFLCGAEDAIHVGEHGGCCDHACPMHADDDDDDSLCCSEMGDSDDRATAGPDAPLPDLVGAVLPADFSWPPRRAVASNPPPGWMLGPPPVGPPPWLRLRMLLL